MCYRFFLELHQAFRNGSFSGLAVGYDNSVIPKVCRQENFLCRKNHQNPPFQTVKIFLSKVYEGKLVGVSRNF
jgi:hypothetical protein